MTTEIPYAQCAAEQCEISDDCALKRGHPGDCYLTEWLHDADTRAKLRAARKQANP